MDHTYCTVLKTYPRRRDTYASRIEKLGAANSKDVSVIESLMVEAGAWLKVVIKDEDEEEEISHTVASEEEEHGESCRTEQERTDSCTAARSPTSHLTMPPASHLTMPPASRLTRRTRKARTFSIEVFQDSAGDIQRYTGLPDYNTFLTLYDFLRPKGSSQMHYWGSVFKGRQRTGGNEKGRPRKLIPMDELFLTLIRLRRDLPRKDLAICFGVSESVVTRVFITWCNVMYERFRQLPIVWSSQLEAEEAGALTRESQDRRQHVLKTVPTAVKAAYLQAAAYLIQSDLAVGPDPRPFDRPFNDEFNAAVEDELARPKQTNRHMDQKKKKKNYFY